MNKSQLLPVASLVAISALILSGCASSELGATEQNQIANSDVRPQITTVSTTEGLVSTDNLLSENFENQIILHIANEEGEYERGHIPGALKLDWFTGLTGGDQRGIIEMEDFEAVARELGIDEDSSVVVYGETHQLFATWAVWVFKIYGHTNIRLLDGGFAKWKAEGRELSVSTPSPEAGNFEAGPADLELRAFIEDVVLAVEDDNDGQIIVDNRDYESYSGEAKSGQQFDGHVSSAENLFSFGLFDEAGAYLNAAEIRERYEAIGVTSDKEIILYCGTGLLASASWFALTQILGYEDVRNYDGSWAEYGNDDTVPIDTLGS